MRVASIIVVCLGNICRSPLGAALLVRGLPGVEVTSAGVAAPMAQPADPTVQRIAEGLDLDLTEHRSRLLTTEMVNSAELILVLDDKIRTMVRERWPHAWGKAMLFDHWSTRTGIADPVGRSEEFHRATAEQICAASDLWIDRLSKGAVHGG